jgi:hypothetical protein
MWSKTRIVIAKTRWASQKRKTHLLLVDIRLAERLIGKERVLVRVPMERKREARLAREFAYTPSSHQHPSTPS